LLCKQAGFVDAARSFQQVAYATWTEKEISSEQISMGVNQESTQTGKQ